MRFVGHTAGVEEIRGELASDSQALKAIDRMDEHLKANGVNLNIDLASLGAPLVMNPDRENFYANERANALLTREYRPGFVVPNRV